MPRRSPSSCGSSATPRAIWLMVPAAAVDATIDELLPHLEAGRHADRRRQLALHRRHPARRAISRRKRIRYVDVGTSGGVWGRTRGYCLMIGGPEDAVAHLDPVFATLAPGLPRPRRPPGAREHGDTAERGYLHCGPSGAGHFVKMVHNGIEYGIMAAYAEGMSVLRSANAGAASRAIDAETTPLHHPEHYRYDFELADIAEVWRRGSVVAPGCSTSLPPRWPRIRRSRFRRARIGFRRRADGRSRRRSTKACRCRCSPRRWRRASRRAARPTSRTSFSPRCASSSAGTPRKLADSAPRDSGRDRFETAA